MSHHYQRHPFYNQTSSLHGTIFPELLVSLSLLCTIKTKHPTSQFCNFEDKEVTVKKLVGENHFGAFHFFLLQKKSDAAFGSWTCYMILKIPTLPESYWDE